MAYHQAGYVTGEEVMLQEEDVAVRDELALIAHLMRKHRYSPEDLMRMDERAKSIMDVLAKLGIDVSEEFPQTFTLDEVHAERLRRANQLN